MIRWDKSIQEAFNKVITYSQNIQNPQTDTLFSMWAENKSNFWKFMGEKLIYEFPQKVTLELDTATKEERKQHFFEWVNEFSETLCDFLMSQKEGFYDNKTIINWHISPDEVIPAGMKINKAIGRYWKNILTPIQIDTIQCEMSRLIQENKVTGILCLSIHPLDYLSLSENQHNWRSCHALDGEYRTGNLSYMLDKTTIIAYIKSDNDTILPRFPEDILWNNKKWRCLFFFDMKRGLVYAGRQYPFFSKNALDLVRQCLFEPCHYFLNKNFYDIGIPWRHNCFKGDCVINGESIYFYKTHICDMDTCIPLERYIEDEKNSKHFNDLLHSNYYVPWTLRFNKMTRSRMTQEPLVIGSGVPCLRCGKNLIYNSDIMLCYDCAMEDDSIDAEWIVECTDCGARIDRENSYIYHGEYYCDHCLDEHTHYCVHCGTAIIDFEDTIYENEKGEISCWSCHQRERERELGRTSLSYYIDYFDMN